MNINLLAIGKKMPSWVVDGFQEYAQRLPKEFKLRLIAIDAYKRGKNAPIAQILKQEGEALIAAVPTDNLIIALDRQGKRLSTLDLADKLATFYQQNQDISLLIGGPEGIDEHCLRQAQDTWSLSNLTLPHPIVRVLIAEQIYRAWSIMTNHPYHR